MKPNQDITLDLYVDADFAGLWSYEDPHDPSSVRSRTGYVITLGGVPIIWKSKLQEQIALSTMEAEYIAASVAMTTTNAKDPEIHLRQYAIRKT